MGTQETSTERTQFRSAEGEDLGRHIQATWTQLGGFLRLTTVLLLPIFLFGLSATAQTLEGYLYNASPNVLAQGYPGEGTEFTMSLYPTGVTVAPDQAQWSSSISGPWQDLEINGTPQTYFVSVIVPGAAAAQLGERFFRVCRTGGSVCTNPMDPDAPTLLRVVPAQVTDVYPGRITVGGLSDNTTLSVYYVNKRDDNPASSPTVYLTDSQGNDIEQLEVTYYPGYEGQINERYVEVSLPVEYTTQVASYRLRIVDTFDVGESPIQTNPSIQQSGIEIVAPAQFVTPSPLPPAQLGVPYGPEGGGVEIVATGGSPYSGEGYDSYDYYLDSGELPSGIFLSGSFSLSAYLSGTTNGPAGIYTFTVAVSDQFGVITLKEYRMGVQSIAPDLSFTSSTLPQGRVDEFYFSNLSATGGVGPYTFLLPEGGRPLPAGLELQPNGFILGVPTTQGTFTVDFLVEDTELRQATVAIPITILPPYPPVILTSPSPLPKGRAGQAYNYQFTTTGGLPPYFYYTGESGNPPPGLSLSFTGLLSGTPTTPGTYDFGVGVYDSRGQDAAQIADFKMYRLVIDEAVPPPSFITTAILPVGEVGSPYSATLEAKDGIAPLQFIVPIGALPPGLILNPQTGVISGTPSAVTTVEFLATVRDSRGQEGTRYFTIDVLDERLPLSITTTSPLPSASLGDPYSASIAVNGGLAPYAFSVSAGSLPPGLSLGAANGTISGTASQAGSYTFTVSVADSGEATVSREFTIVVSSTVRFTTQSPLPDGQVGVPYAATIGAERGTTPYLFSVIDGQLPNGLSLDGATGVLSGTPTAPFSGAFTVRVRDAAVPPAEATRTFQIRVLQPLELTVLQLPTGTVNVAYSLQFGAQGGVPGYTFTLINGSLPAGLSLSPSGLLSGTASAVSSQTITVRVTDSEEATAERSYTLEIRALPVNGGSLSLSTAVGVSNTQNEVDVTLSAEQPDDINGTVTLSLVSNVNPPVDDPTVQFISGGRTVAFTIPAGQTSANFGQAATARFQTGTTAATLVFTAAFQRNGQDVTPSPAPQASLAIPVTPPTLTDLGVTRSSNNLTVVVRGFAPERNITTAVLEFTRRAGAPGNNPETFNVNVTQAFQQWFGGSESAQFGSQFRLTIPVTLSGDPADIIGVTVRLTGPSGTGNSLNATF